MHVQGSPLNPNAALDAAYAAQKAAASREAAETRKKLADFAFKFSPEDDSFVLKTGDQEESKNPTRRDPQNRDNNRRPGRNAEAEDDSHISDWA